MKKPKDMTQEELRALPAGPYSQVDDATGRHWISKPVLVSVIEDDDILATTIDGVPHMFGQFADGTWYRQPF